MGKKPELLLRKPCTHRRRLPPPIRTAAPPEERGRSPESIEKTLKRWRERKEEGKIGDGSPLR
jgi:hypothetical protein